MHATDSARYLAWALRRHFGLGRVQSDEGDG
jgi:hypothetical protein